MMSLKIQFFKGSKTIKEIKYKKNRYICILKQNRNEKGTQIICYLSNINFINIS